MTPQLALDLTYQVIFVCAKVSAPFLLTAIVVGVLVNIVQTVTSIRDQSITFIPKVVASAIAVAFALPWVIGQLVGFTNHTFQMFSQMVP
jgi:flagellar biosynthetic protein FliQ